MVVKKVVVGLSGGVDSAIAALILKKKGFDVQALHMVNWDPVEEGHSVCPRSVDERDAQSIALRLDIPFHTVNFVKEYWNEVFSKMVTGYTSGRTVVPDIECNRIIKFDHLHRVASSKFGADFVATGHYVRVSRSETNDGNTNKCHLLRAVDPLKDQSFFLCTLTQQQLRRSIFPLGAMTKREVKKMAEENGLGDIAARRESMGLCFVGKRKNFGEFLQQYVCEETGRVLCLETGKVLSEHEGIHLFTPGKRLHIKSRSHLGYFVAFVDPQTKDVYAVEGSAHPVLFAKQFVIRTPEWISYEPPFEDPSLTCRIQRTHNPIRVRNAPCDGIILVTPSLPLRAVAPGQMCVFYKRMECLGGGEIIRVTSTLARGMPFSPSQINMNSNCDSVEPIIS